jgi:serine/threonine-protein kinase SRPK3
MVFELATGDYLFEPKKGKTFKKNEDHLALITELLGECKNKKFLRSGDYSSKYYNDKGNLKAIKQLKFWPLINVLLEKYRFKFVEAYTFADFLMKALVWEPKNRATAK